VNATHERMRPRASDGGIRVCRIASYAARATQQRERLSVDRQIMRRLRFFLAITLIVALLAHRALRREQVWFMLDAMQVAENRVGRDGTRREWPSDLAALQAELEHALVDNHRASVACVWLDADGRPVDVWGTPFRGRFERAWVRCESAGPDREFGTRDDITSATAW